MPPCHHWSWSSMNEASDHLTTVRRSVWSPAMEPIRQVELRGEVGVLRDPDLRAVELDDQHALGGAHMEDHAPPAHAPGA